MTMNTRTKKTNTLQVILRLLFTFLLIVSLALFPFWVTLILSFVGVLLFPWYIEGMFIILILDSGHGGSSVGFVYSVVYFFVLIFASFIRKRLL
ncbi:MAG: hypothetical protein ACI9AR_000310 [Flavobacteriaceae bacterium]|jgi:hypothetical protein